MYNQGQTRISIKFSILSKYKAVNFAKEGVGLHIFWKIINLMNT